MYMYVKSVNVQSHVPHTTLLFQFQFFLFGTVRTKCRTLKHKEQAQRQAKNSINYTTLMSYINKCIQYNQLTFQCVVVVFTSVRNGLTKRDKSHRAWSTHCNKVRN